MIDDYVASWTWIPDSSSNIDYYMSLLYRVPLYRLPIYSSPPLLPPWFIVDKPSSPPHNIIITLYYRFTLMSTSTNQRGCFHSLRSSLVFPSKTLILLCFLRVHSQTSKKPEEWFSLIWFYLYWFHSFEIRKHRKMGIFSTYYFYPFLSWFPSHRQIKRVILVRVQPTARHGA